MQSHIEAKVSQVPRAESFSLGTNGGKSILLASLGTGIGWYSTE